jgi:hypothetical protein
MENVSAGRKHTKHGTNKRIDRQTKGIKQGINVQHVTGHNRKTLTCGEMGARENRKRSGGCGGRASGPRQS